MHSLLPSAIPSTKWQEHSSGKAPHKVEPVKDKFQLFPLKGARGEESLLAGSGVGRGLTGGHLQAGYG